MTLVLIDKDELAGLIEQSVTNAMRREMNTTPIIPEPDPESLWTAAEIAKASGMSYERLLERMRLAEEAGKLARETKDGKKAIRYKDIPHLDLKVFHYNLL